MKLIRSSSTNIWATLFLFLILISCNPIYNEKLLQALELSGKNRVELEKVLAYYSKSREDKVKLKAAEFLISNMHIYSSKEAIQLDKFDAFFDSVGTMEVPKYCSANVRKSSHIDINKEIQLEKIYHIWNYYRDMYGPPDEYHINYKNDLKNISADLLIENIDYAFKAWEYPWAKHLSFEQFCEYVLPYRFGNERLESWRPIYMEKYQWLIDSVKDPTDPVEVCRLINRDIAEWFMFDGGFIKEYPRDFTPTQLLKLRMGHCRMQSAVASFAMRSMGLAIAHAQILQWGNRNMGHDFSAVLSKEGKFIDFLGGEHDPGKNRFGTTPAKIYNETFSLQEKPVLVRDIVKANFTEATPYYTKTADVTVNFSFPNTDNSKYAYLCVFNNKDWIPVHFAKVNGNKATFKDMGCNLVYLPIYRSSGYVSGYPFILYNEGNVHYLKADSLKTISAVLKRKYYWDTYWADSLMDGGKFQGANKPDFSDAEDLYIFKGNTEPVFYNTSINNTKLYKYAGYMGPEGTNSTISEIVFFENQNKEIKGKPVGTPGDYLNKGYTVEKAFDKDILTYFDGKLITGSRIGLKFNKPAVIKKIRFMGRNDGNCVEVGDKYELVYWNASRWESLGFKTATSDTLIYRNCPGNALLLLHNHTKGKQERIFTINETGDQVFW